MRRASSAWPSTLLILWEPVWLRSSRLSRTRQPSSADEVGALGEQRRAARVVAQQAIELGPERRGRPTPRGTRPPAPGTPAPGSRGRTGRRSRRSGRWRRGRPSRARRSRHAIVLDRAGRSGRAASRRAWHGRRHGRSSTIQSNGRTSRSPCSGGARARRPWRPRRRPASCGRPCARAADSTPAGHVDPPRAHHPDGVGHVLGRQAAGQDDPAVGRRPLGERPVEDLARAGAWPSR